MSRINNAFQNGKAFIAFVTCGDPDIETTKNVILADSVINTGKTVVESYAPDMMVACCVINEKAVPLFRDNLYAVRVSSNSFVGAAQKTQTGTKGPDTTMRLFNQI